MERGRVGDEFPAAKVGEVESGLDLSGTAKVAQGVVREVATDTAGSRAGGDVLWTKQSGEAGKGSVGNTLTTTAVGEVKGRSANEAGKLRMAQVAGNVGAIATETADRVEDGRGQKGSLGTGIEGPVPVGLTETEIPTAGPESLFILGKEQTVVRVEDALWRKFSVS